MTKLVYFAWVRERIGKQEEESCVPASVATVAELLVWLKSLGEGYQTCTEASRGHPRCDQSRACRPHDQDSRGRRNRAVPADDRRLTAMRGDTVPVVRLQAEDFDSPPRLQG